MAQRDYVRRGQSAGPRRKKSSARKKQSNLPSVSPTMVATAAAIVVAFIGALYFITHHKNVENGSLLEHQASGNKLPPKPEERWRYIKELENRKPGVSRPTEPSAGGEVRSQPQLTSEQRQLLAQMQADMRQQPMQLNEVPGNEQTNTQRQQTLQRQKQAQQRASEQAQQLQTRISQAAQPYQDIVKAPQPSIQREQPKAAPITREADALKPTVGKQEKPQEKPKTGKHWMVQCGSFKGSEQAESVRAKLAFEGFDTKITTNNGWNRVVIGPLRDKEEANATLNRLKGVGHSNCIRLSIGG